MEMKLNFMYIYLDIAQDFQCEMCGRCCKNDWLVTLDEKSYQRNREVFAARGELEAFSASFLPLQERGCLGEYAAIAKQESGGCCFLEADNRCRLHREFGHEHLDSVCMTFPRYLISSARGVELTLTLNCPAVLKRLWRVEPLEILRSLQAPFIVGEDAFVAHVYPGQKSENDPLRYYFELEMHFIDLLQTREEPIERRLMRIAGTIEKLKANDDLKRTINAVFNDNYEALSLLEQKPASTVLSTEILQEHFLVNLVFQKIFYLYGLEKGFNLLCHFRREMQKASDGLGQEEGLKALGVKIMELSFQHSHNRKLLQQA